MNQPARHNLGKRAKCLVCSEPARRETSEMPLCSRCDYNVRSYKAMTPEDITSMLASLNRRYRCVVLARQGKKGLSGL